MAPQRGQPVGRSMSLQATNINISSPVDGPVKETGNATYHASEPLSPARSRSVSSIVQTRSLGHVPTVTIEWTPTGPPSDDDIVIVPVRISHRSTSGVEESIAELPARPPARGFFRRMSTRIISGSKEDALKIVKMPRRDYKRFFARDTHGAYIGTEPQREWTAAELERDFGRYQDILLTQPATGAPG